MFRCVSYNMEKFKRKKSLIAGHETVWYTFGALIGVNFSKRNQTINCRGYFAMTIMALWRGI